MQQDFTLELMAKDDEEITLEAAKASLIDRTQRFVETYRTSKNFLCKNRKIDNMLKNLEDARYWGVLYMVDGQNQKIRPGSTPKPEEAQTWSKGLFSNAELQEILTITVNQAILIPHKTSWPGTYHGYSALLEYVIEKEGTMFSSAINSEFRDRAINLSFWEQLAETQGNIMRYIRWDYSTLDLQHAKSGIKIFRRNMKRRGNDELTILNNLGVKEIDNYLKFVCQVDDNSESLGATKEEMAVLISPYICNVIINSWDGGRPKYNDKKSRLDQKNVSGYLKNNATVRKYASKTLARLMDSYSEEHKSAIQTLRYLPDKNEIFALVVESLDENSLGKLLVENSTELSSYITENEKLETKFGSARAKYEQQRRLVAEALTRRPKKRSRRKIYNKVVYY
ncbi:hypothetical protein J4230_02495 [Candidatus Woesearchaeota archaeon]|nr:hypothetical protein [Candidatus Woesearchaeota archaeon]